MVNNVQQIVFELIILIANLCLLVIAILDKHGGNHIHVKYQAAQTILFVNTIAYYTPFASITIKILLLIAEKYRIIKVARKAKDMNSVDKKATNKAKNMNDVEKKTSDTKEVEKKPEALQTSMINLAIETLVTEHMDEEEKDNKTPKISKKPLNYRDNITCMSPMEATSPTSIRENSPFLGGISQRKVKNRNDANSPTEMRFMDDDADAGKNQKPKGDQGDKNEDKITVEILEHRIKSFADKKINESLTHKDIGQNKVSHQGEFEEGFILNDSENVDKSPIYILNPSPSFLNSQLMFGSAEKDVDEQL